MRGDATADVHELPDLVDEPASIGLAPVEARRPDGRMELPLLVLYASARAVRLAVLSVVYLPRLVFGGRAAPVLLRRYLQACGGGFIKRNRAPGCE